MASGLRVFVAAAPEIVFGRVHDDAATDDRRDRRQLVADAHRGDAVAVGHDIAQIA